MTRVMIGEIEMDMDDRLFERLDRYEKALKAIAHYDDGLIRQYEELGELCNIYENIARGALK